MSSFVERHRNTLIAVVIVLGIAGLIYVEGAHLDGPPAGTEVPEFALPVLASNERVTPADFTGHVTVLDFWATWCGPCKRSLPDLDALATKYAGKVRFYAVNAENEEPNLVQAFKDELGLKMTILLDGHGLFAKLGGQVLPTTVILDREGKVARSFRGATDASEIAAVVDSL